MLIGLVLIAAGTARGNYYAAPYTFLTGGKAYLYGPAVSLVDAQEVAIVFSLPAGSITGVSVALAIPTGMTKSGDETVTVSFYAANGSYYPTGAALASTGPIDIDSLYVTGNDSLTGTLCTTAQIDLAYVAVLAAGNYAVGVSQSSNGGAGRVNWGKSAGSGRGTYERQRSGGGAWGTISINQPSYDIAFTVGTGPATNPTPADASGPGIDFSGLQLSWQNALSPNWYSVYVGPAAGSLTLVSEDQVGTTYTTTLGELQTIFAATPINGAVYWRVDSNFVTAGILETGTVWSFDPRPGKAATPAPANAATDVVLATDLGWSAGSYADTYHAYGGVGSLPSLGDPTAELAWVIGDWSAGSVITWRIDSTNEFGTTAGDAWSFTTESGGGDPGDDPPGTGGSGHGGGIPPGSADADSPSGTATIVSQMIFIIESDE